MDPLPNDVARGPQKESHRSSFLYLRQDKAERIVYGPLEEGQREKAMREAPVNRNGAVLATLWRNPSDLSSPEAAAAAIEVTIIAQEKCWCY